MKLTTLEMPEFLTEDEQDLLNDYYNRRNGTSLIMSETVLKRYIVSRQRNETFLTWEDIHKSLTAIKGGDVYIPGKVSRFICKECNKVKPQSDCNMPGTICTQCLDNKEKKNVKAEKRRRPGQKKKKAQESRPRTS